MRTLFEPHGFRAARVMRLGASVVYRDQELRAWAAARRRPAPALPGYAVCPVCGFHDRARLHQELADRRAAADAARAAVVAALVAAFGAAWLVDRLRPRVTRHRWVCAVYER